MSVEDWARRECSVLSCARPIASKGLCNAHYLRQYRHGSVEAGRLSPGLPAAQRIRAKSQRADNGCLVWTDHLNDQGYGALTLNRRVALAHRVSYELANGPIPDGLEIDHLCHNRACIEPAHLRAVTREVNQANRRGAARGSKTGVLNVHPKGNRFVAGFKRNGKRHHVGSFVSVDEARAALQAAIDAVTEGESE